jgi:Membrane-bound toxin component of toxin-antitoxin system
MDRTNNPFLVSIRLSVNNSPILLKVVICLHVICLILPWISGLDFYLKVFLTSTVILSLGAFPYFSGLYNDKSRVDSLILNSEDDWKVLEKDGAVHHAELDHRLFVHPWLTIISLKFNHRKQTFIFTPETVDADLFRRLRVRLRYRVGD